MSGFRIETSTVISLTWYRIVGFNKKNLLLIPVEQLSASKELCSMKLQLKNFLNLLWRIDILIKKHGVKKEGAKNEQTVRQWTLLHIARW
jgi:hypothetical protein